MEKIAIISNNADYGNVPEICNALRTKVKNIIVVLKLRDKKGLHSKLPNAIYGYSNIPRNMNQYIIMSGHCFANIYDILETWIRRKAKVKVVLTDISCLTKRDTIKKLLKKRYIVYCMPDIMPYYDDDYVRTFYPPFQYEGKIVKNDVLTISHSPFTERKMDRKGTELIVKEVERAIYQRGICFDLITGVSWDECIERKARTHIFIDQVVKPGTYIRGYDGAIGKSGIEAMVLGNMVFTSGNLIEKEDMPLVPVERINKDNLYNKLLYYTQNSEARRKRTVEQKKWADKYASYEFMGEHLLK